MPDKKFVWGTHPGVRGEAESLFLEQGLVALGWDAMGDLSAIAATREAFRKGLSDAYPDAKPGAVPVTSGQLYRFLHEIREGDLIAFSSSHDRHIHIGRISGPYRY